MLIEREQLAADDDHAILHQATALLWLGAQEQVCRNFSKGAAAIAGRQQPGNAVGQRAAPPSCRPRQYRGKALLVLGMAFGVGAIANDVVAVGHEVDVAGAGAAVGNKAPLVGEVGRLDRKSTRLNSSHLGISY